MWNKRSVHHILPRSRDDNNSQTNLIEMSNDKHRAIHRLFENRIIAEQLITTINLSKQALRPDIVDY